MRAIRTSKANVHTVRLFSLSTAANMLHVVVIAALMISLLVVPLSIPQGNVSAQDSGAFIRLVHQYESKKAGVDHPGGMAYVGTADGFFVLPAVTTRSAQLQANILTLSPLLGLKSKATIAQMVDNPLNIAYDPVWSRLLLYQSGMKKIVAVDVLPSGKIDITRVKTFDAQGYNFNDVQGLAVSAANGDLFVLEASAQRIVRVRPAGSGSLDWATTSQAGGITPITLNLSAGEGVRGIAFDPATKNLHTFVTLQQQLYEVNQNGEVVARRDLSGSGIKDIAGIAFAPTQDSTDAPSNTSLYIAESRLGATEGLIDEFSFTAAPVPAPAAAVLTLVRTIDASKFSPPSPDTCGVEYIGSLNNLMIVDSEVEEMSLWQGVNLWRTTLAGAVNATYSTTGFTNEATGIAYNEANKHFFFSSDDDRAVYELNPGSDGVINTSDDKITSFRTSGFSDNDAEGIAYDSWNKALFIVDGVNAEVYRVAPGANGIFDGITSPGDDQVSNFDTAVLGVTDPEGIAFNTNNGHLYIVGKPSSAVIEVTTGGSLVQTLDISAAHATKPAGLGYGRSSSSSTVMSLYITDRGVDNNTNSSENDGKVYEIALGTVAPVNQVPVVSAGPDQTVPVNASATLDGTVSDDGLPNPPGTLTTNWTKVSGPGTVTFARASSVDTTATFSAVGSYTLRLTASDSQYNAYDDTVITVTDASALTTIEKRINTSSDDVEEFVSDGSMYLNSGDLELGSDGSNLQAVGMRFTQINIPQGATITNAYVQFKVDEVSTASTSVTFWGEAADNAAAFTTTTKNVTNRAKTTANVPWSPAAWGTVGEASLNQRSPNLTSVIQQIVSRPGWASGNAMDIIVTAGTGWRTAEAYDGDTAGAPLLHVEYKMIVNNAPKVTISSPTSGSSFLQGAAVNFTATASDTEDGNLTQSIAWTSSIDRQIGTGGTFTKSNLSVGVHTITASVTDSGGKTTSATTSIEIKTNTPPVLTITSPANNAVFTQGSPVTFTGTVTDAQESNLAASIVWSSDLNGPIGVGASVSSSTLKVGIHTITASVTDGGGLSHSPTIAIEIKAPNTPPNLTITAPTSGSSFLQGSAVTFTATALDTQDGSLSAGIKWSSSIDKLLGTGASITINTLSIGTHTITASVTDSGGLPGSAQITLTIRSSVNVAPVVNAGPDQSVTRSAGAVLHGTASDDGLPEPPVLTTTWSKATGPGLVTFANPNALDTTAAFSTAGTYTLRLTASDGLLANSDDVIITVSEYTTPVVFEKRVNTSSDDAEEYINNGTVDLVSSDLELGQEGSAQMVGMRFTGVTVPPGAVISSAYVQFQVDEVSTGATSLTIWGEASDNPVTFTTALKNVTARAKTAASVPWIPVTWPTVSAAGIDQRTPEIAPILQQIVNRPGWTSGNSLVLLISGTGRRTAEAYDGVPAAAPLLHLEYRVPIPNNTPSIAITAPANGLSFLQGAPITFTGIASDSEDGDLSAGIKWSSSIDKQFGTGASVTVSTLSIGAHTITASVTDSGGLPASATLQVVITDPNTPPVVTITSPVNGASILQGNPITFTATAADAQDGSLADKLTWTSNLNQQIGTGGSFTKSDLTVGVHTITASVTDSGGKPGSATITLTIRSSVNVAPVVNAGPDQSVTRSAGAVLHGTASDDGLPEPPVLTTTWSKATGPGLVTFANPSALDTTAAFSTAGTYTLRLTASDGLLANSDDVIITISEYTAPVVFEKRVNTSSDDAEEYISKGTVDLSSTDLELGQEGSAQMVGMRFTGVAVPPGAVISSAYVQFQVDQVSTGATSLTIWGEAGDNPLTFTAALKNVTGRAKTAASVPWIPTTWPTVSAAGIDQRTPDIASILQQIVSRPGWTSGNSLVLLISGTGRRTAEAYDGVPAAAPLLHLEYRVPEVNTKPAITITSPSGGTTFIQGAPVTFTASAFDTQEGDLTANLKWTSDQDGDIGTGGSFTKSNLKVGAHRITTAVTDAGGMVGSTEITIAIKANTQPVVTITSPANPTTVTQGDMVSFTASVSDAEESGLADKLVWKSDLDKQIGTGSSFSKSDLSVGTHTITASVIDIGGLVSEAKLTLIVKAPNTAPTVTIEAPANNTSFNEGASITFTGQALDVQEGELTALLKWTSTIDGEIGTGASFSKTLSVGKHHITATVKDNGGLENSASVDIEVKQNTPPQVTISKPINNTAFTEGTVIEFAGSAVDAQDGPLTALVWTLENGNVLHTGAGFSTSSLITGRHTITASATDSGGKTGSAQVEIVINTNQPPEITITAPNGNLTFAEKAPVTFTATANDPEEGNIAGKISWKAGDHVLGSGASVTVDDLSAGVHTITATIKDSLGLEDSATLEITVENTPPTVVISSPTEGTTVTMGEEVTFTGSASDAQDGELTGSLKWTLEDGTEIGTGGSFMKSDLPAGTHTITATVTDQGGQSSTAQVTITVQEATSE